jgi:predicted MFS family arabinose efflux permease
MKTQLKELLLLHFLNDGMRTTLIVLLPFITKDLSLSLTQAGFLGASQPLIAALVAIPTGYILGRFGGIHVIFTLLAVYSLSMFGLAFSLNASMLFSLYFLAAIGFGMFHTVGFTLTAKVSTPENVGRNMGNFTAIGEIGRVALPPLAIFALAFVGWRVVVGVFGFIGLLLFIASRFFAAPKDISLHKESEEPQSRREFLKDIFFLFKNKQAAYVTLAAIIDSLASSPIYVYLPFLLLNKGLDATQLGIAMGGFFIGSLLGKKFLGLGVDKLGNVKVFVVSEFCMALSLIFISQSSQYLLLLFFTMLLGIFTKGTSPVVQTMFSELSHKDHYHKIFAVSELALGLSAVVAITILGSLADKTGITIIFYVTAVLAIIATIPIFAFSRRKVSL